MELSEQQRKEIYQFIKKRREQKNNPVIQETDPEKIRKEKIVDECMRNLLPSYYELQKKIEEAADSAWFAFSELQRVEQHMKNVHDNDPSKCHEGCLEDFTREDGLEYMEIIINALNQNKG